MLGLDRFETRRKQVWNRAKVMEAGNGDVEFGAMMEIESLLMLIEGNSSRQTTLYRPEIPAARRKIMPGHQL